MISKGRKGNELPSKTARKGCPSSFGALLPTRINACARHEGRQAAGGKFAVRAEGAYVFYCVEVIPAELTFQKRNQLSARHEGKL